MTGIWPWLVSNVFQRLALAAAVVWGVILLLARVKQAGKQEEQLKQSLADIKAGVERNEVEAEVKRDSAGDVRQRLRRNWGVPSRNVSGVEADNPDGR